ncbi:MAG: transposase [Bryobacterales bacterium]|nr:transposase [Bryobacterales bacterium]
MARQKRYVKVGEPVHATARGTNRTKIFRHGFDKRKYLERFALVAEQEGVEVHGYCIMDNHIHFLLVPTDNKLAIGRLFLRVHTWWAQRFNKLTGRSGHLFQSRFHSAVLDSAYYFAAMRYIDLNPQAARLVDDPADFEFSSARAHLTGRPDPLLVLMMDNWRHQFSNDPCRYRDFLKETRRQEQDRLEKALRNGFPLGSDDWITQLEQESHRRLHPAPPGRPRLLRLTA